MAENVVNEYVSEPAGMQGFKESAYYQSLGIEPLQEMLKQYTQDDAALRAQAEAQYRPGYEIQMKQSGRSMTRRRLNISISWMNWARPMSVRGDAPIRRMTRAQWT